jgi:hypothetical protein
MVTSSKHGNQATAKALVATAMYDAATPHLQLQGHHHSQITEVSSAL